MDSYLLVKRFFVLEFSSAGRRWGGGCSYHPLKLQESVILLLALICGQHFSIVV